MTNAIYIETGHMCPKLSTIKLASLAVPAAGPGYAERCMIQHTPGGCQAPTLPPDTEPRALRVPACT